MHNINFAIGIRVLCLFLLEIVCLELFSFSQENGTTFTIEYVVTILRPYNIFFNASRFVLLFDNREAVKVILMINLCIVLIAKIYKMKKNYNNITRIYTYKDI